MQIDTNYPNTHPDVQQLGPVRLLDLAPRTSDLLTDALNGLRQEPKALPCKYFYDARGSELFERITRLREYYPTRTELSIMQEHASDMADAIGDGAWLVEFGSGSGLKTQRLLASLHRPVGCVLVDISKSALVQSATDLASRFGNLDFLAVCADYTQHFALPEPPPGCRRITGYFPGSTIGNFARAEALIFLKRVRRLVGDDGSFLVGFDRVKDVRVLEAAYNDGEGVTEAFNLNVLTRLKAAGADVDPTMFDHRAIYDREQQRIEMQLVSRSDQLVRITGECFALGEGEIIVTEHSHKYDLDSFVALASEAGFALGAHWSDARQWFSVCHLVAC